MRSINSKTYRKGLGCPVCSRAVIVPGVNDLATTHSDLAAWFDTTYEDSSPQEVSRGSRRKVHLKCPTCEHTFSRTVRKFNGFCEQCHKKKMVTLEEAFPEIASEMVDNNPSSFSYGSSKVSLWKCRKCSHLWERPISQRTAGSGCPKCSAQNGRSQPEKDLEKVFLSWGLNFEVSTRKILPGNLELDFYFPEHNIAVEYNGLYWHSEASGKDRNYQIRKWRECREKEIQLVAVWEDDWIERKGIVLSMLAHKLGVSEKAGYITNKVFARKTTLERLSASVARDFLEKNHIQGYVQGTHYLSLKEKNSGEIVAVSVWTKRKGKLTLDRYATSEHVVGGMGKLLSYVKNNENIVADVEEIVTFADHAVSDGGLYHKLGFTLDKQIRQDYYYVGKRKRREHKTNYKKSRFKKDPNLIYREGLSETELAHLNGLNRVWDYGKDRFVMKIEHERIE